jgi:hypothetical protein
MNYMCFLCNLQLKQTVQSPCGALFCWECAIASSSNCPKCGVFHNPEQFIARADIDSILSPPQNIVCPHCSKQIISSRFDRHLLECDEVPIACINKCGTVIPRKSQTAHFESCPLQLKMCTSCNAKVPAFKYEDHITQHAKFSPSFVASANSVPKSHSQSIPNTAISSSSSSPRVSPLISARTRQRTASQPRPQTPPPHSTQSQTQSPGALQISPNAQRDLVLPANTGKNFFAYITPERINFYFGYVLCFIRGLVENLEFLRKSAEMLKNSNEKISQNVNMRNSIFLISLLATFVLVYIFSGPVLFLAKMAIFCFVIYSTWIVFHTFEFARNEHTRNVALLGYMFLCIYLIKMLL